MPWFTRCERGSAKVSTASRWARICVKILMLVHVGTCWRCTCVISGYKRKSSLNGHLIIEASSGKPDARQKELIDLPWSSQLKGWSLYFADPNSTILISHARLPSVGSQHAWLHFGQQFPGNRVFPRTLQSHWPMEAVEASPLFRAFLDPKMEIQYHMFGHILGRFPES